MENNGTPKTISPRTNVYKEAARNTIGFHVHANDAYIGFYAGSIWDIDSLVKHFKDVEGQRLISITGNVLIFSNCQESERPPSSAKEGGLST